MERDFSQPDVQNALRQQIADQAVPRSYAEFVAAPMASWLETSIGLRSEPESGRLLRQTPKPITGEQGVAQSLSALVKADLKDCEAAIRRWLLGGYICEPNPDTGARPFAFRLHQFISRGDAAYATLEDAPVRHMSLSGQKFVPGNRDKLLFPLAFCRECGADYYTVWKSTDTSTGRVTFKARDLSDRIDSDEDGESGFLHRDVGAPWPDDPNEILDRLPDDWLDVADGRPRIRPTLRDEQPQVVLVDPGGNVSATGLHFTFVRNSLTDLLNCNGQSPTLTLLPSVKDGLTRPGILESAHRKAQAILDTVGDELNRAPWYTLGMARPNTQAHAPSL